MTPERETLLARIEEYYDLVPREAATAEEVGPFTLFVPDEGTGWHFYARPRLHGSATLTPKAVEKVLARQVELGLPPALEWVDEVTPSLLPAVRGAGHEPRRHPLLTLARDVPVEPDPRARPLPSADPHLGIAFGTVKAGFRGRDEVEHHETGRKPELIEAGALIVVASYEDGRLCGAGSAAPRGDVAELMGTAVPPGHRNRGHGSAITRSLIAACRERGVDLVFLTASSDTAAGIYRRVGFTDTGRATSSSSTAELPDQDGCDSRWRVGESRSWQPSPDPTSCGAGEFIDADLRGARFVRANLSRVVMRGVDVAGADIDSPWLLEGENSLQVNDEWSFAQTLRHLVMATDVWLRGAILEIEQPYHPIGQPNADYETDGYDLSVFSMVAPSYDDVLEVRAGRVAMVRDSSPPSRRTTWRRRVGTPGHLMTRRRPAPGSRHRPTPEPPPNHGGRCRVPLSRRCGIRHLCVWLRGHRGRQ